MDPGTSFSTIVISLAKARTDPERASLTKSFVLAIHPLPALGFPLILENHQGGVPDVLRGIHESLAERAGALLKRVEMKDHLTLIGGVARQAGIARALEDRLKVKVNIPPDCDFICALGAALLGLKRLASKWSSVETAAREYAN